MAHVAKIQLDQTAELRDRVRRLAFWFGSVGLVVHAVMFVVFAMTGGWDAHMIVAGLIYSSVLASLTISSVKNYCVNKVLTWGLIALFLLFWTETFIEGLFDDPLLVRAPLTLFIPLFLAVPLSHKVLLGFAPTQTVLVSLYGLTFGAVHYGVNWSIEERIIVSVVVGFMSGTSFVVLAVIAYAREKSDIGLIVAAKEHLRLASTDPLTGLLNRRAFVKKIGEQFEAKNLFALGFIDLDRFKPLNDQYGHAVGDQILCLIAARCEEAPEVDFAARLGGDEFAIVLKSNATRFDLEGAMMRVHQRLTANAEMEFGLLRVQASLGFTKAHCDAEDVSTLLQTADKAMQRAKSSNSGYARFSKSIDSSCISSVDLETRFPQALRDGKIRAAIQPIANAKTKAVTGYELLARWVDSGLEKDPSPAEFIPIAEKNGLLNDVLWATLNETLRAPNMRDSSLSINISPAQLLACGFLEHMMETLDRYAVSPESITLEVTEHLAFRNLEDNVAVLNRARDLGMQVALDDFGTGYSSISMLHALPLDRLKIDKSLVGSVVSNSKRNQILEATIQLAKKLDLKCCVEGVESERVFEHVANLGADQIQGFWLGKPRLIEHSFGQLRIAS